MRTNIIPAQITTVEDKVAGNLSLTQIILIFGSLFLSVFIYAVVPVKLALTLPKVIFIFFVLATLLTLSVRVQGRIILSWLVLFISYFIRPKIYVFDKKSAYLRKKADFTNQGAEKKAAKAAIGDIKKTKADKTDPLYLESLLENPKKGLAFKFRRKGGLSVSVSEQ